MILYWLVSLLFSRKILIFHEVSFGGHLLTFIALDRRGKGSVQKRMVQILHIFADILNDWRKINQNLMLILIQKSFGILFL